MPTARRAGKAEAGTTNTGPRILKKYPNRRLYDTHTSSYITLADVKKMVLAGTDFEVRDAKSGEDLTRSILLQIIRVYGHAMQGFMGAYLEKNVQTFAEMQKRLAEQSKGLYDTKAFSPELWTQFMNGQAPMMQGLMGNYLEQSKNLFVEMQRKMAEQAGQLMPQGFPGFPGAKK